MVPNPNRSRPARSHTLDTYDNPLALQEVNKRWFSKALPQAAPKVKASARIGPFGLTRQFGNDRRPSPANVVAFPLSDACHSIARLAAASCPCAGRRLFQVILAREDTRFFQIEHGLEAQVLRMVASAGASCRTDGTDRHKSPNRAHSSGTRPSGASA